MSISYREIINNFNETKDIKSLIDSNDNRKNIIGNVINKIFNILKREEKVILLVPITNEKNNIRIESATLGRIIDYEQNDPNDMGRVMAPAAIDTLKRHLDDLGRKADYYDLILTGDLGRYGKDILKDYMAVNYDMELNNYDDCGAMLYDYENQEEVLAGGSGPVCSALVNFGYIFNQMRTGKLKRVLLIATGALFSPTLLYQKQNINSIAHAISLEVL